MGTATCAVSGSGADIRRYLRDVILPVAAFIGGLFVLQAAVAKPYEIPTESMEPTIQGGDRIVANRLIYEVRDIERGDIIVFDPTPAATRACGGFGPSSDRPGSGGESGSRGACCRRGRRSRDR